MHASGKGGTRAEQNNFLEENHDLPARIAQLSSISPNSWLELDLQACAAKRTVAAEGERGGPRPQKNAKGLEGEPRTSSKTHRASLKMWFKTEHTGQEGGKKETKESRRQRKT